jgi:outer membrane protein assembly factor BamB
VRAADAVVAVTQNDALFCLDIDSGAERWRVPPSSEPLVRRTMGSTPAVSGGRVFHGDLDGVVRAVDARHGTTLWTQPLGSQVVTATTLLDGEVIIGTLDGRIVALSPADGNVRRTARVEPPPRSHFVRADSTICVFLSEDDWTGILVGLDSSLETRWRLAPPDRSRFVSARPFVRGDVVLAGTSSGAIVAVDPSSGRVAWTHAVDPSTDWSDDGVRVFGSAGDTIFVGTIGGVLYALSER